jgi:hypothetical protein
MGTVFPATFAPDSVGICVLGGAGALLGLAFLIAGSAWRRGRPAFGLALLVLAAAAALVPLLGPSGKLWVTPLLLAGAGAARRLSSWPPVRRLLTAAATLAAQPAAQATALLVAGPLLIAGWACYSEGLLASGTEPAAGGYGATLDGGQPELLPLWTDQGGTVPVIHIPTSDRPAGDSAEAQLVQKEGLELRLLRTGEPSWSSNCHGWVFTAGRYLIDGEAVDLILKDNGYQRVATPQPGDLIVYRAGYGGGIAHTGVVRVAGPELLLVESKWNELGVYLHRPEDYHPRLGLTRAFYRSPRRGHLLRGLDDATGPAETAAADKPSSR